MERVKETVVSTLKNVPESLLSDVLSKLQECGCESLEDLQFIQESDLCPPLKPVQCRKLLQVWKISGMYIILSIQLLLNDVLTYFSNLKSLFILCLSVLCMCAFTSICVNIMLEIL